MKPTWRAVAWVGLGLALALVLIWLVQGFIAYPTLDNVPTRWDHYRYIAISRHPFASSDPLAREAPYCWRVLTPLLVYLSPLNWRWSFMLLTLLGMGGAALTLHAYLQKLGYDAKAALFGLVLFFSLSGLMFNLRDFYLSDPLALFAVSLGFYLLLSLSDVNSKQKQSLTVGWLLAVLVLGALAKETILALLPLIILKPSLTRLQKIILCLAPVLVLISLRVAFPSSNNYSYADEMSNVLENQFFGEGLVSLLMRLNFAILGTWGPVLVLLLYRPRDTFIFLKEHKVELIFLAIIYTQIIIAHNVERLLVYGFMLVIPLLVHKMVLLCQERNLSLYALLVPLLALQLIYFYGRPPFWASLLVCGLITLWMLRFLNFVAILHKIRGVK